MLGTQETTKNRKTYLNIKEGEVVKRTDKGEEKYSFVEGELKDIYQKERTFRGENVQYWYIDLRDLQSDETYSIGFAYGSNVFKSIILQLSSERGLQAVKSGSPIKISPYFSDGFDKVKVTVGEDKLDWKIKTLPQAELVPMGGVLVKDYSKRMELISSLVDSIKEALSFFR